MATKASKSVTAQEAEEIQKALATMNPELRKVYDAAQADKIELETNGVLGRWKLGAKIKRVMENQKKYGEDAAGVLGTALGIGRADFSRMKALATVFDKAEITALMKRTSNANKRAISWSHLTVICGCNNKKLRTALINRFFKEETSVRDLEAAVQEKLGNRGNNKNGGRIAPRTPTAGLNNLHKLSGNFVEAFGDWEVSVFEPLTTQVGEHANKDLVKNLQQAEKEQDRVIETATTAKRKLAASLDAVRKSLASKSSAKTESRPKRTTKKKTTAAGTNSATPRKKKKRRPADAIAAAKGATAGGKKKKKKREPATA